MERSLLRFNIGSIPRGSLIQTASLQLYLGGTTPGAAPMTVAAHRIISDSWSEAITWNQHLRLTLDLSLIHI